MKKSKKVYWIAFIIGLANLPFVFMTSPENLRNLWFSGSMMFMLFLMIGFAVYAMRLENEGR
jgi:hypothetical protein